MSVPGALRHAFITREEISIEAFLTPDDKVIAFERDQFKLAVIPPTVSDCLECGFLITETSPDTIHPRFRK